MTTGGAADGGERVTLAAIAAALRPTRFIDSDHRALGDFVRTHAGREKDPKRCAVSLYYAVRDAIRYDPYRLSDQPDDFRASSVLAGGSSWCVPKAVVLVAAARAAGIPALLGFADVRNHLSTPRLHALIGTDVYRWHGYCALRLDGHWRKCTPTFNVELCRRFGVRTLEFDGEGDSLLQPYDSSGRRHMEYLAERGLHQDLPFESIVSDLHRDAPRLLAESRRLRAQREAAPRFEDEAPLAGRS